jgi:predicted esterase
MATDEVFALMDRCQEASRGLGNSLARVRFLGVSHRAVTGLSEAVDSLGKARADVDSLATALDQLAVRAAEQESRRQQLVHGSLDRLLWASVAAAAWSAGGFGESWARAMRGPLPPDYQPPSSLKGATDEAITDDTASILRGAVSGEASVAVSPVWQRHQMAPASSMAERIARIPDPSSPVRVERYVSPDGNSHTDVYIAGTSQWSVGLGQSPFDMESNLGVVAGVSADSVHATSQAMRHAGVKPGDSVSFIGHSQGGAVAATLAASGVWATRSLVTVGAPTGTLPVRGDYRAVVIEHSNDVVPRLSGARVPTSATIIRRDTGHAPTQWHDAHSTESYRKTAQLIDASEASVLYQLDHPVARGTQGTATVFSTTRQ